ncbi:MAG: hypothetical protein WCU88_09605 [Elusimicrobiota bacterium]|jgi:sugar lactone lactonase YvrE
MPTLRLSPMLALVLALFARGNPLCAAPLPQAGDKARFSIPFSNHPNSLAPVEGVRITVLSAPSWLSVSPDSFLGPIQVFPGETLYFIVDYALSPSFNPQNAEGELVLQLLTDSPSFKPSVMTWRFKTKDGFMSSRAECADSEGLFCGAYLSADSAPPHTSFPSDEIGYIDASDRIFVSTSAEIRFDGADVYEENAAISRIAFTGYAVDRAASGISELDVFTSTFTLAEGEHSIVYASSDNAGNVEPLKTVSLTVDGTAPGAPLVLRAGGASPSPWQNSSTFTLTWQNPQDVSGIKAALIRPEGFPEIYVPAGPATAELDLSGMIGNGANLISARLMDNVDNESAQNSQVLLRYDDIAPVSLADSPETAASGPFPVAFDAEDEGSLDDPPTGSGPSRVSLWWRKDNNGNGAFGAWQRLPQEIAASSGTFSFAPAGDGEYQFYAQSSDAAGNAEDPPQEDDEADVSTYYDATPASITAAETPYISPSSAQLRWATDDLSSCVVEYGTSTLFGRRAEVLADRFHSATLGTLVSPAVIYYRVIATNRTGLETVSSVGSFQTPLDLRVPTDMFGVADLSKPMELHVSNPSLNFLDFRLENGVVLSTSLVLPGGVELVHLSVDGMRIDAYFPAERMLPENAPPFLASGGGLLNAQNASSGLELSFGEPVTGPSSQDSPGRMDSGSSLLFAGLYSRLDPAAPGSIADFSAVPGPGQGQLTLSWTAVGDDAEIGTSMKYDLRIATEAISQENFRRAAIVEQAPLPAQGGMTQGVVLSGLDTNTTYYLGLKALDEVMNASPLAALSWAKTPALPDPPLPPPPSVPIVELPPGIAAPPAPPTLNIQISAPALSGKQTLSVALNTFNFEAPFIVDAATRTARLARLVMDNGGGACENGSSGMDYVLAEAVPGPATENNAADYMSSPASRLYAGYRTAMDPTAPGPIVDLAVSGRPGRGQALLSWTATGDDSSVGAAMRYDLRASSEPIIAENFDSAAQVLLSTLPAQAGTPQSTLVSGLADGTVHYFALKAVDEAENPSSFSGAASTRTLEAIFSAELTAGLPTLEFFSQVPGVSLTAVSTTSMNPTVALATSAAAAQGLIFASALFDVVSPDPSLPGGASLLFRYIDPPDPQSEPGLRVWHFKPSLGQWLLLADIGPDTEANLFSLPVDSLSFFAILSKDKTAPSTALIAHGGRRWTSAEGRVFDSSATLYSFSAADGSANKPSGTGIASTEFRVDSSTLPFMPAPASFSLAPGFHTVQFRSKDAAGNLESIKSAALWIDGSAPSASLSSQQTFRREAYGSLAILSTFSATGGPAGLDILVSDPLVQNGPGNDGSGLAFVRFGLDTEELLPATSSFTLLLSTGIHALRLLAEDQVGNRLDQTQAPLRVSVGDILAPRTSWTVKGASATASEPANTGFLFVSTSAQLEFSSIDDFIEPNDSVGWGVSSQELRIEGQVEARFINSSPAVGGIFDSSWSLSSRSEGLLSFSVQAEDLAGNIESPHMQAVFVDAQAPRTSLFVDGISVSSAAADLVLISTDILSFISTDTASGVASTRYRIDDASETVYASTFSLASGTHTLSFRSMDNVLNEETLHTLLIDVKLPDSTPPSLSLLPMHKSTITTATPLIAAFYSDESGIAASSLHLTLDGMDVTTQAVIGTSSACLIPAAVLSQGTHTFLAEIADMAGNRAKASSSFFLDSLPPLTTLLVNDMAVSSGSVVIVSTDALGFVAVDAGAGLAETRYSLDGSTTETVFASTFCLPAGIHALAFHSIDRTGNVESLRTVSLAVQSYDVTPPLLSLLPVSGSTITLAGPAIVVSYSDSGRGMDLASVRLSLDGTDMTAQAVVWASSAVYVPAAALSQGTHTATTFAADLAGNGSSISTTFLLDSLPPATALIVNGLQSSATTIALVSTDTLAFAASDAGAGVQEIRYGLDGATEMIFTSAFNLAAGTHTLSFYSLDAVGNIEPSHPIFIRVRTPQTDDTPPLTRLDFPSPLALGVEQAVGGIITIHGAISDESSLNWTLESAPGANAVDGFVFISSGAGNISGILAAWDARSLPGYRTLRLSAMDSEQNASSVSAAVYIGAPIFDLAVGRKDSDKTVPWIKNPTGIVVRSDGSIWVAGTDDDSILLLSSSGTVLKRVGGSGCHGRGRQDLRFQNPQGLALDSRENLYIADQGRDRVVKLSPDGSELLMDIGKQDKHGHPLPGSGQGEFRRPFDVAVDADGGIYVADSGNGRIQVFNEDGRFLRGFSRETLQNARNHGRRARTQCANARPERDSEIRGITLSAQGLWVSDRASQSILLFSRSGELLREISDEDSSVGELSRMRGLASDRLGALYVVERSKDRIQKFDPQGKGLLAFGSRQETGRIGHAARRYLTEPMDAAIGPDGALWVTDAGRDRIVRYALPQIQPTLASPAAQEPETAPGQPPVQAVEPARRIVDRDDGAFISRDDGNGVDVPAQALAEDLEISVDKAPQENEPRRNAACSAKGLSPAAEAVEYGPSGTVFSSPALLVLSYDPLLLAGNGLNEDDLKIHYWNDGAGQWEVLPSAVDKQAKTVSARTGHFSVYQVLAAPQAQPSAAANASFELHEVYAFPNPARKGAKPVVHAEVGLAEGMSIRVYDVSGRLVHSGNIDGAPGIIDDGQGPQYAYEYAWEGHIPSGVYFYAIEARKSGRSSIRKTGKLGVVR